MIKKESKSNVASYIGWGMFVNCVLQSIINKKIKGDNLVKAALGGAAAGLVLKTFLGASNENPKKLIYMGTKKWGKLQKLQSRQLTSNELIIADKLGLTGAKRVAELYGKGEKYCKFVYEKFPGSGTRWVVSSKDNLANEVINNFYTGEKSILSFDENHHLSKELNTNPTFQNYYRNYLRAIKNMIIAGKLQKTNGSDIINYFPNRRAFPNFSVESEIPSYDYYGLIGGVQQIEVYLEVYQISENKYQVFTKMFIRDCYGADKDDIEGFMNIKTMSQSLPAFYVLQNCFGCHPFITEIIYSHTDTISIY